MVITHRALYMLNVMQFGLRNARATFGSLMEGIFPDQIGNDLAGYIDALHMYALSQEERLPILDRTMGQLIEPGLSCKPRKCKFFL